MMQMGDGPVLASVLDTERLAFETGLSASTIRRDSTVIRITAILPTGFDTRARVSPRILPPETWDRPRSNVSLRTGYPNLEWKS
jgi:hypothetical protein